MVSTYKITTVIRVDLNGLYSSSYEPLKGCQECFSGCIKGSFQVDSSHRKANEDSDVIFNIHRFSHLPQFQSYWTSIIHPCLCKWVS